MKIKKLGHCCLLIEVDGKRIMTDPGMFTAAQHIAEPVDLVVITHEHGDHVHVESLLALLTANPDAQVVTNSAVGKLLDEAGIAYTALEGTDTATVAGIELAAHDAPHVEIYQDMGLVQNTGYFITKHLFYPGDAYAVPEGTVEILALPVAGPWACVKDVVNYALAVKPQHAFPVHDAVLSEAGIGFTHGMVGGALGPQGIDFHPLKAGETLEL